jgi:crotonobetainyl-CoA:carnitine CoA-transferase CaiB-like acyl-CoA transferase
VGVTDEAPAPLRSVRVVELAHWVAGPAAGGLLADWGAEVVKVEPPGGDPMRWLFASAGAPVEVSDDRTGVAAKAARHTPAFSAVNRAKKSVTVDLSGDEGQAVLAALLDRADVLLTNLRPAALERLALEPAAVAERWPDLIYCSVTAYGWDGPARDEAGYDLAGFFARAGVSHQLTPPSATPAPFMNGLGDMFTALSAVAGILAALHERHESGRGRFVEPSLLRTGMWSVAGELSAAASGGRPRPVADRTASPTPLFNVYQAGDGRWFVLVGVEADRHLPSVLAAVERTDLLDDERFASAGAVRRNRQSFIAALDEAFARRPRDEWATIFARHDVWWGPIQSPEDVVADPQAAAAGAWVDLDGGAGRSVDAPIRFDRRHRTTAADAPGLGAHTAEVLAELGIASSSGETRVRPGVAQ